MAYNNKDKKRNFNSYGKRHKELNALIGKKNLLRPSSVLKKESINKKSFL